MNIMGVVKHEVFDYDRVDYKAFWQNFDRDYEDAVERIALRRLTADMQGSCLEIGRSEERRVGKECP